MFNRMFSSWLAGSLMLMAPGLLLAVPVDGALDLATRLDGTAQERETQGRYADASSLRARSLAIKEQHLGRSHATVVRTMLVLATDYDADGHAEEAENLYREALALTDAAPPPGDDDARLVLLNNLATLLHKRGEIREAESLFARSLDIAERKLGSDDPSLARILWNLGGSCAAQDELERAARHYERMLALLERPGPESELRVPALNALAAVSTRRGDPRRAEALYRRSIEITDQSPETAAGERAKALNNLAALVGSQGRSAESEHLYLRALAALEAKGDASPDDVAKVLLNLAAACERNGRAREARDFRKRAERTFPGPGTRRVDAATGR